MILPELVFFSIKKGESIIIPIYIMNTDKATWGEDAGEFRYYGISSSVFEFSDLSFRRPERWEKMPEAASALPGVWGNIMSFLGGPRACIGYRFSLAEYVVSRSYTLLLHHTNDLCRRTKALAFTLIRSFEFELGVPHAEIAKKSDIVTRPYVRDHPEAGHQLPVVIKPVVA